MLQETDTEKLRESVGDSFNIYQATVAMVAIFIGFVFSGLLQLLTSSDKLDAAKIAVVWLLTLAMFLLSLALMCFHATAHRVLRYWRIFYPVSTFNRIGAVAFSFGLVAMFCSIAVLLWIRGLHCASGFAGFSGVALILFGASFRGMHGKAKYMVHVDELPEGKGTPTANA
jgi:hypothetical protein